ncbi:hypothetical protein HMPREF9103_00709 [Lentilactobacillus parafarraginis F0439]|uniref:Uncharacterized protein n=1 Tax=Lentilactobacillus parafarraginis F0439 TaxID=797515 RepID=G9ZLW1_9LACO|nr:hypothetical protein HMPREF9103_00709 [Lentilactobacillus parafarraginis F0439]
MVSNNIINQLTTVVARTDFLPKNIVTPTGDGKVLDVGNV